MKKKLLITFIVAALIAFVSSAAAADSIWIYDTANIVPDDAETALNTKLGSLSGRYSFAFYVVTVDSTEGTPGQEYADGLLEYLQQYDGSGEDAILLLWDDSSSAAYITTSGYGIFAFTDAGLDYVFDRIGPSLRTRNFSAAFDTFADTAADLVDRARAGNRMTEGPGSAAPRRGANPLAVLFGSAFAGFVPAGIVTGSWKSKLKSVRAQSGAAAYTVPGSLRVVSQKEHFLYNEVTRTKKENGTTVHKSASGSEHGGASRKF